MLEIDSVPWHLPKKRLQSFPLFSEAEFPGCIISAATGEKHLPGPMASIIAQMPLTPSLPVRSGMMQNFLLMGEICYTIYRSPGSRALPRTKLWLCWKITNSKRGRVKTGPRQRLVPCWPPTQHGSTAQSAWDTCLGHI